MGHHRCPEQYSCPLIDDVIDRLCAVGDATVLLGMGDDDGEINSHLLEMGNLMEDIRQVNHGLREWGCGEARQRDALELEVTCLKDVIRMLQGN